MHHKEKHNNSDILKGLAAGLVGGLVGTIVMTQYQNLVTQIGKSATGDDKKEKKQEKESSENATVKTAKAISETVFDHKLKKSEKETAGNAVHYVFGTTVGALYGAAAEAIPATATGYGLPFGTALFIGADEVAVPALGLSEPPTEIPMTTHAYALSSHLVYGLTADIVRRAVRKYI